MLTDGSAVDMFKEDHIDAWSDMPVAHFSFLLKTLIPTTVLEYAVSDSSVMNESLTLRSNNNELVHDRPLSLNI